MAPRTMTVKELIKELLEFDMTDPVFICLGKNSLRPEGSTGISHISEHSSNITCGYGVYVIPSGLLIDKNQND